MSTFDKIMKGFNSGGNNTAIPSFKEGIYIFKKDDIDLKFYDANSETIVDLNFFANIQPIKIPGHFSANSKPQNTKVGPRYQETLSIMSTMSVDSKNHLISLGYSRLCAITIKEDTPVKLYGATMGLYLEIGEYFDYNIKFETVGGFKEPRPPKEIWITAADGSQSIEVTIAEIEKLASH